MFKTIQSLFFFCLFSISLVKSYYLEGEYPWCKPTNEIVDLDRSCKLGSDENQHTLNKIFEMICFDSLNELLESKPKENEFLTVYLSGNRAIFYNKEGSIFYTNCTMVKVLEIKENSNISCSNDLAVVFRSHNRDIQGFITSNGIVRDEIEPCNSNYKNFNFYNLNSQRFVKYKNFVKQRDLNISSKPINITDPFGGEELKNGFLDLYEKNVFSNTKISVLKDLIFFIIILTLTAIRFRERIKKFIRLVKHLKSRYIFF